MDTSPRDLCKGLEWLIYPQSVEFFDQNRWLAEEEILFCCSRSDPNYFRDLFPESLFRRCPISGDVQKVENAGNQSLLLKCLEHCVGEHFFETVSSCAYHREAAGTLLSWRKTSNDVFVMQTLGTSEWLLTRGSIPTSSEGSGRTSVHLECGDLLFLPKNTVYTTAATGSASLVLLQMGRTDMVDYLLKGFKAAARHVSALHPETGDRMPVSFTRYMGIANRGVDPGLREAFQKNVRDIYCCLASNFSVDVASDRTARRIVAEGRHGAAGLAEPQKEVEAFVQNGNAKVRMKGLHLFRIMPSQRPNFVKITYAKRGSRRRIHLKRAKMPMLEYLISRHPSFVHVSDLPATTSDDRTNLISTLLGANLVDLLQAK